MNKLAIITHTERGLKTAVLLQKEFTKSIVVTTKPSDNTLIKQVPSTLDFVSKNFNRFDGFIFIGALGICIRTIASSVNTKQTDPAIVNIDDHGLFVQSVLSGHTGSANDLTKKVAAITGSTAVLSTSSDLQDIWALDVMGSQFGWSLKTDSKLNEIIALFVSNAPTAVLINSTDKGTKHLLKNKPDFVSFYDNYEDIKFDNYQLFIAVSSQIYEPPIPSLFYIPKTLYLGTGCSQKLDPELFAKTLTKKIAAAGYHPEAIHTIGSASIKANQTAYVEFCSTNKVGFKTFEPEELALVEVPNPSDIVNDKVGTYSVSEASALLLSGNTELLVQKQKVLLENDQKFTYAIATKAKSQKIKVAIVGAGPGDENLITVRGKELLEQADCVLYAGSLIPEKMTNWCKPGAVVRNSASLTLEEQIALMQEHYHQGNAIVRLQCGDPSIYGAIQEQMTLMDDLDIPYYIVPGISSFSAAAAALKSEFTIPEKVQTIILTRGEGQTPLPPSEKLEEMAKHQATLCIFLSAAIPLKIQSQLLNYYPPNTPVAVLYRLTWDDEEIYKGELKDLAAIVKKSQKKRTVLIVVGEAIGARENRSKLYNPEWKHIFRKPKSPLNKD